MAFGGAGLIAVLALIALVAGARPGSGQASPTAPPPPVSTPSPTPSATDVSGTASDRTAGALAQLQVALADLPPGFSAAYQRPLTNDDVARASANPNQTLQQLQADGRLAAYQQRFDSSQPAVNGVQSSVSTTTFLFHTQDQALAQLDNTSFGPGQKPQPVTPPQIGTRARAFRLSGTTPQGGAYDEYLLGWVDGAMLNTLVYFAPAGQSDQQVALRIAHALDQRVASFFPSGR